MTPATSVVADSPPRQVGADALVVNNLSVCFGATQVLNRVSLTAHAGERLALIGPNGAGKSTLFNLISGRFAPTSGDIFLAGQSLIGRTPWDIQRMGLCRSFQINQLFGHSTVEDNLRCAVAWSAGQRYSPWPRRALSQKVSARVARLLKQLGLTQRAQVLAAHLSYPEQRTLELGLAVASSAKVLLLDEPTSGMSKSETLQFVELIRHISQGKTLILIEHDMSVVFALAHRVAVLAQGELLCCDTPEKVRTNPLVQQAYLGMV